MRNLKLIGAAVAVLVLVQGCAMLGFSAGQEAREELAPKMSQLWPVVAEEVQHGIDNHPTIDKGSAMLALDEWNRELGGVRTDRDDLVRLRDRDWTFFAAYASQGIAHRLVAGEIGPAGEQIARDNLAWFDAALRALDGPE